MSEKLICSSWASFKAICITQKNLNLQYEDSGDSYYVLGPDANNFNWSISIPKQIPDQNNPDQLIVNPDATDFETNVKPACNFAIGNRLYPCATPDMQSDDDSTSGTFSKSPDGTETISDIWYEIVRNDYISGGEFWTVGAKRGDWLQVDVVDKDGIYAPAGTVLGVYINSRRLCPVDNYVTTFERNYWAHPPAGLYIRIRGHIFNTSSDVLFDLNLFMHKPL